MKKSRLFFISSVLLVVVCTTASSVKAQALADRCVGVWSGTMKMYSRGVLRDSVRIRFTVAKLHEGAWSWKTEYLSATMPMVKDYVLRVVDAAKGRYITDEGGGVELTDFQHGDKLYSVFETQEILLTSSYELVGDRLIFEVTSGKKEPAKSKDITTYSVDHLQRVVLTKQ